MDFTSGDRAFASQMLFFQQIREKLPTHISLVDELEDLLEISQDSAYRRIRGEKELSFGEIQKLVSHFGVSSDSAFNSAAENIVSFSHHALNSHNFTFHDYLSSFFEILKPIPEKVSSHIIYTAKDMPLFHYFMYDELAAFMLFVWQKSVLGFPQFNDKYFSLASADEELISLGKKMLKKYNSLSTTELWSEETLNSILNKLEYYCQEKLFDNMSDAGIILAKIEQYIEHLCHQAEAGYKLGLGRKVKKSGKLDMYYSNFFNCDNSILINTGEKKLSILLNNDLNFLVTTDTRLCNSTEEWIQNFIPRTISLTNVSDKQRNIFFNRLRARYQLTKEKIKYQIS